MAEIADLLALWQDKARSSESVKRIAAAHVDDLTQRIGELFFRRYRLPQQIFLLILN